MYLLLTRIDTIVIERKRKNNTYKKIQDRLNEIAMQKAKIRGKLLLMFMITRRYSNWKIWLHSFHLNCYMFSNQLDFLVIYYFPTHCFVCQKQEDKSYYDTARCTLEHISFRINAHTHIHICIYICTYMWHIHYSRALLDNLHNQLKTKYKHVFHIVRASIYVRWLHTRIHICTHFYMNDLFGLSVYDYASLCVRVCWIVDASFLCNCIFQFGGKRYLRITGHIKPG